MQSAVEEKGCAILETVVWKSCSEGETFKKPPGEENRVCF